MNKGFGYYFKRSWSLTRYSFSKLSFIKKLELAFFLLVITIGSSIPFLSPLFILAGYNAAKMVDEIHTIHIGKCFEGITKDGRYKELLVVQLYEYLVLAIGAGLFYLPNLALSFGYMIDQVVTNVRPIVFVVTIVLYSIFSLIVSLAYLGAGYVACNTRSSTAGDIIFNTLNAAKHNGWTAFVLTLVYGIILSIFAAGPIVAVVIINSYFGGYAVYASLAISIVYIFVLAFIASPVTLMLLAALYGLYKDTISIKRNLIVKPLAGETNQYSSFFPTERDEVNLLNEANRDKREGDE